MSKEKSGMTTIKYRLPDVAKRSLIEMANQYGISLSTATTMCMMDCFHTGHFSFEHCNQR